MDVIHATGNTRTTTTVVATSMPAFVTGGVGITLNGKTAGVDTVTPHRIVVLVYARELCLMKSAYASAMKSMITTGAVPSVPKPFVDGRQRRQFSTTMLELIQGSDLDLRTLLTKIKTTSSNHLYDLVLLRIKKIATDGVSGLMDFIQSLETLLVDPNHPNPVVQKSSVIGLFVRRMMLVFDKLSFGQTTSLHASYRHYCHRNAVFRSSIKINERTDNETNDDVDADQLVLDSTMEKDGSTDSWLPTASRRQAELFVARQVTLLLTNEGEAFEPSKLQKHVKQLLSINPNLPEAHFLSLMNSLRVREYVGAINALHRTFDCCSTTEQGDKQSKSNSGASGEHDPAPQNFRFAALNLGSMLCYFGYREEALLALREAMKMAREANDNVCLQHALSWLYRLENERKDTLVERSITKAGELSLPYLASLGILTFTQMKSSTPVKPAQIFDFLRKCDIINCQHSIMELMTQSYSQKVSLWNVYGKKQMTLLSVQLLLYLNTTETLCQSSHHCAEALCRALCQLALLFADEGNYDRAEEIFLLARERFPSQSSHSIIRMFFEQVVRFDRALKHCDWREADMAVSNLVTINVDESRIRLAEILMYRGEISKAQRLLSELNVSDDNSSNDTDFKVRVLILCGLCHCHANNSTMAILPLCCALTLAQQFHLSYWQAVASLHLAFAQYLMNYPSKAIDLMDTNKVHFLSNGSVFDRARALLLHAKCRVAQSSDKNISTAKSNQKSVLQEAAVDMGTAAKYFLQAEAYCWAKDAFYRQAMLYDELGFVDERNKAAFQFRKLDQQNMTTTVSQSLSEAIL